MAHNHNCLKKLVTYCFALLLSLQVHAQYYLRGEVKDEQSHILPDVKIFVHSARLLYQTGAQGSFGFTVLLPYDSLTLTLEGYESKTLRVKSDAWQNITLKTAVSAATKSQQRLISITKDFSQQERHNITLSAESYFQIIENEFMPTSNFPNTGFSLDVDKASYSNVRRFLNMNSPVPPDAVRIEELVNYFNLHYSVPPNNETFSINSQLSPCPWSDNDQLLYLNVNARKLDLDKIPPGNFVFLIDISGSMDMPNRLPLLKAAFQSFVKNLRPIDKMSIVVYGGTVGIWLPPTSGSEKDSILQSIEQLSASGSTPGESGIRTAYKLAESTFLKGGNNRVILATDGDFNVGQSSEKELDELITKMRQTGVYLTCLGVGMGNFKDSKLQTLAKKGNGNYAYLDDIKEAERVLVKELTQTFYAVADDVFMNIQFNPSMVKEYRLIGFDNRKDALTDSTSNLPGGEIGSGNSTLAIFQIVPTDQNRMTLETGLADDIAKLTLRYSLCGDTSSSTINYAVSANFLPWTSLHKDLQFAGAVAMFGLKLRQSKFCSTDWDSILAVASAVADQNNYLQSEFLQLVAKAEKIYQVKKHRKK